MKFLKTGLVVALVLIGYPSACMEREEKGKEKEEELVKKLTANTKTLAVMPPYVANLQDLIDVFVTFSTASEKFPLLTIVVHDPTLNRRLAKGIVDFGVCDIATGVMKGWEIELQSEVNFFQGKDGKILNAEKIIEKIENAFTVNKHASDVPDVGKRPYHAVLYIKSPIKNKGDLGRDLKISHVIKMVDSDFGQIIDATKWWSPMRWWYLYKKGYVGSKTKNFLIKEIPEEQYFRKTNWRKVLLTSGIAAGVVAGIVGGLKLYQKYKKK